MLKKQFNKIIETQIYTLQHINILVWIYIQNLQV